MGKKQMEKGWREVSKDEERMIVRDRYNGLARNVISRKYNVPAGQILHIIKESCTGGKKFNAEKTCSGLEC